MPHYFFDFRGRRGVFVDETGTECANLAKAREEAFRVLVEMALEEGRGTEDYGNAVTIRNDWGGVIATVSLSVATRWTHASEVY